MSASQNVLVLLRELREMAEELGQKEMIARIDGVTDLVEELRRNQPGRKPDPKHLKKFLSVLQYAEAVKSARKAR